MMSSPDLMTAVQHKANIIICIFDNGSYGTIRMHQERDYPGRVEGTKLVNPNFKKMAESIGATGYFVENSDDFLQIMDKALISDRPVVIHAKQSIHDIAPGKTLMTA